MGWIGWAVVGIIVLLACVIISAAWDDMKYNRELIDEYRHPPDSEVENNNEHT